MRSSLLLVGAMVAWLGAANAPGSAQSARGVEYRLEPQSGPLQERFSASQMPILESLNRADRESLERLPALVVPASWSDDPLTYATLPRRYEPGSSYAKMLVVHIPHQMFGAYEKGHLVRWGPVSTGGRFSQTPAGLFHLNWRSTGHASSIDPSWFLQWYFNFESIEGLAFHLYALPGAPASHGCIRLLERDARWLFEWGEEWRPATGAAGTPVLVVGQYDFDEGPPWRQVESLSDTVELPPIRLPIRE